MPFKFYCRNCNQKLEAPDELYGNLIECPQCGGSISVPDPRKMLGDRPDKLSMTNMSCPLCGEPGLKLPDSPFGIATCSNCHSIIPFHEHQVHDDPAPLPTLRDYHIVRRLGRGGSGSVYEARQVSLNNRSVAIKILEPEKTAGLDVAAEVAALVRLSHPCIVRIFDLTVTDSIQGIVMELVTGPHCEPLSLRDVIAANGGKLPPEAALAVGRTVCTALDYAHHQGVLHLDLKPDNILVDHLGMLRIVDFGIARSGDNVAAALDSGGKRTLSGSELGGTPGYVAPERRDMKCPPSAAMDIYSLGAIIYEMLTGEVPGGRFMLPSEINPAMPAEIDAIIDQSLNFHPEKRYPSMAGFGESLGHSLKILRAGSISQDRIPKTNYLEVNDNTIVIRRPGIGIRDDDADEGRESLPEKTLTTPNSRPFPWKISLTAMSLLILLGYCTFRKPGDNTPPPPVAASERRQLPTPPPSPVPPSAPESSRQEAPRTELTAEELFRRSEQLYHGGNGVARDEHQAFQLLKRAADMNYPPAQNRLGELIFYEEYGFNDPAKAVELFHKAAEQSLPKAMFNLGECHYYGSGGLTRNYAQAVSLYRQAMEQGCREATYALARCFDRGHGVDKNHTRALILYRQAAAEGFAPAQEMLGNVGTLKEIK